MPWIRLNLPSDEGLVSRFLVACMVLGFACLLVAGATAAWVMTRNQIHIGWVNHTYEVEIAAGQASTLIERAETSRRGYLLARQRAYRDAFDLANRELAPTLAHVERLTRDNPRQQSNVRRLRRLTGAITAQRLRTIALVDRGRGDAAVTAFVAETGIRRMRAIRDLLQTMSEEERRLLATRDADQRRSVRTFYIVLAIAGALLLLVALVSLAAILRYTRDLSASRDRLRGLNDTLEERVTERTADLALANEEIQRFAYIVSHDLRSPLVNVMGFTAELEAASAPLAVLVDRAEAEAPQILTEEARLAAREDLPEAVSFIRTSTQKMDRLINAILQLSRQGRRTIMAEEIDVPALIDGIVGSMRHVLDERGVVVDVARPMPVILSDRLAVEQILSNLVENAAKYLQPGRPGRIAVSALSDARGRVAIAVADNGRGIDARDHSRVFDLFRRSGAQDQPGEGIGLAHVRALAYRLGGTVSLESQLGEGATFTLSLPLRYTNQEPAA